MDIKGPAYLIDNWGELIIFVIYQNKHYMLELLISFLQRISTYQYSVTYQHSVCKIKPAQRNFKENARINVLIKPS
jgi:hypothetical protein